MKKNKRFKVFGVIIALLVVVAVSLGLINIYSVKDTSQEATYLTQVDSKGQQVSQNVSPTSAVEETTKPAVTETAQPEETKTPETHTVSLLAVGDDLIHTQVIKSGKQSDGSYNFDHLYEHLKKEISAADISVINQETVLGGKSLGYSGYPRFNSPTEIGDAIVKAGFDVVLGATNHSMDKGEQGLQNAIDYWKTKKAITVVGVNETQEEYNTIPIVEKNGIKIAMLNYTYGLNGLPLPDGREYMVNLLEEDKVLSDIKKAKEQADFVIVFPHWGTEYTYEPTSFQEEWTKKFADAGVDLVIGAHPHVLEPVEWVEGTDGHKMLVYYSLGNYVSGQSEVPRMLGGMANVTITKTGDQKAEIKDASITPIVTHYTSGYNYAVYKLSDYTDSLAKKHKLSRKGLTVSKLEDLSEQILGDWYKK